MSVTVLQGFLCTLTTELILSGYTCDACHQTLGGGRIICLDCRASPHWRTMDFCADSRCYSEAVTREDMENEHVPTHDFVKIRTNIQWHDLEKLKQNAADVLRQWRLRPAPSSDSDTAQDTDEKSDPAEKTEVKEKVPESKQELVSGHASSETESTTPSEETSRCFACHTTTHQPFWYCTQCTGMNFFSMRSTRI